MIANIPHMDIVVFSDGSKLNDGTSPDGSMRDRVGAGALILQAGITVQKISLPLSPNSEVFDAEIAGALAGLTAAISSPGARFAKDIHILLDNKAAAESLLEFKLPLSSQTQVTAFRKAANQWTTLSRYKGQVAVKRIPGHSGIQGNDTADLLTKEACAQPPPSNEY